jgi:hypothetical protein
MTIFVRLKMFMAGAGVLAVMATWSGFRFANSYRSAQVAAENLSACRQLAQQISDLATAPTKAWQQNEAPFDSLRLELQQIVAAEDIGESNLISVNQQQARRLGEGDYLTEPAQIELRNVTLGQLVSLLLQITQGRRGLNVQAVRLSAPRGIEHAGEAETWSAEVILTHLIFSPKSTAP